MNSRPGVTATTDMAVLPGVLGCRSLRRTVQVRLGTNPAVPRDGCPARGASACAARGTPIFFALAALRSVPHRKRHLRQAGSQFRGLATAIHEISGLERTKAYIDTVWWSIGGFTLSVAYLLLPWRSAGIDLAFYY